MLRWAHCQRHLNWYLLKSRDRSYRLTFDRLSDGRERQGLERLVEEAYRAFLHGCIYEATTISGPMHPSRSVCN